MIPILSALVLIFVCYGLVEWHLHLKNISKIPIRIVVNGTRGKSTVTRLIAAGLKGGGFKVMAKTTGTKPRMVINNETEVPVVRLGRANIREQLKIFREAVKNNVEATVFENMSLRPDLQYVEESVIVKPQIVVITNVRSDHLDVMGPTLEDIARNFMNAVPRNAIVFTAERELFPLLETLARNKGIRIIASSEEEVSDEEMLKFSYVEHKENVALALKVCQHLGVDRQKALEEMYKYIPDPGVLRRHYINFKGKKAVLYNAMAANDPDSTFLIYQRIPKNSENFYILMNCRSDRIDRSKQMAELVANKIPAKHYFITGGSTYVFVNYAKKYGINKNLITDLGGKSFEEIFDTISTVIQDNSIILAIGNTVGYGEELIKFLLEKGA
ncbi:MAG: poly-gamma-glutamate synthase PgsB [Candidatus Hydrothermia bacterium]